MPAHANPSQALVTGSRSFVVALGLTLGSVAAIAHDATPLHLVTVSGAGEVSVKPDRARLSLGVESRNVELKKAEDAVNTVVRAYLRSAKSLGARDEDVGTSGVSISPEYAWEEGKGQRFTGYRVARQVDVRITNLDKLGDFILRATTDGVTQVNPPSLESTKAVELARQALAKAAEDARAKARVLAEALGAKLGGVQRISESGGYAPPQTMVMMSRMAKDESGSAEMGVTLGEIRYSASISADFDLLPP